MLYRMGICVAFCIAGSVVSFLDVSFVGLIASVGEERAASLVFVWYLVGRISSYSWYLE